MTYVFDKDYCEYGWWYELHIARAYFVTRLKTKANDRLSHLHSYPLSGYSVSADEIVLFSRWKNAFQGTLVRHSSVKVDDWNPRSF